MPTVNKLSKAEEDLFDIWYYIAIEKTSRVNADRFIKKMDKAFSKLASSPDIGVSCEQYGSGIRRYTFGNYLIFYSRTDSGILIERIVHGRRNTDTAYFE